MSYADYLQSKHWQKVREKALMRARYECEECGWDENLNVHHSSYKNLGKPEELDDLHVLCYRCHMQEHEDLDSCASYEQMQKELEAKKKLETEKQKNWRCYLIDEPILIKVTVGKWAELACPLCANPVVEFKLSSSCSFPCDCCGFSFFAAVDLSPDGDLIEISHWTKNVDGSFMVIGLVAQNY